MSYSLRSVTRRNQTRGESILPIADAGSSAGNASMPPISSTQATKSYSDAVAERSPSTSPDVVRKSSDNLSAREEAQDASFENRAGDEPSDDEGGSSPSSVLSSPEDENRNPWVKVTTRRSRSLDSLQRTNSSSQTLGFNDDSEGRFNGDSTPILISESSLNRL
jgi:hypothetical protein